MSKETENKETVPFVQFRLLVLAMEAARVNDQEKIKQIHREAAMSGIQMSQ